MSEISSSKGNGASTNNSSSGFSEGLRTSFWPVHPHELKKVLPMVFMFFCISFDYNLLKTLKDTLILSNNAEGASAILFLKVWGVLPIAVLATLGYVKLSSMLSKRALFYATLIPFLVFLLVFAFAIYPNRAELEPVETAQWLAEVLPSGGRAFSDLYLHWVESLFFIVAELWSAIVMNMLFWAFANDITRVEEAKRLYPVYALGAIFALLGAGSMNIIFGQLGVQQDWNTTFRALILSIIGVGTLLGYIYHWIQKNVLTDPRFYTAQEQKNFKMRRPKASFKESLRLVFSSKYLGLVAVLMIGYNMSINLVEITWKQQVSKYYQNPNELQAFWGGFLVIVAMMNILMTFLSSYILRKWGWRAGALATPVVLLVTGGAFFIFVLAQSSPVVDRTFLFLAVLFGAIQNAISKSIKYTLFDATKEMAYIPLQEDLKIKGKAAVDVIGSRLGKSGGSLVQQGLLFVFHTLEAIPLYAGFVMAVVITLWIRAVYALDKDLSALLEKKDS